MTPEQTFLEILVAKLHNLGILEDVDIADMAFELSRADGDEAGKATLNDMAHGLELRLVKPLTAADGIKAQSRFGVVDGGKS